MEIRETTSPQFDAYLIRTKDTMQSMGKYIGKLFGALRKEKLSFGGKVFCVYYEQPDGNNPCDFEMGASLKGNIPAGNANIRKIGGAKCITLQHRGSYSKLGDSWDLIRKYVKDNKIDVVGPPFEVYTKGPILGFIMIPSLLVTDIYMPVK